MKRFYLGIKALIMEDEKLLLLFDRSKNYWDTPGGRVDGSEQFMQTLVRELKEEISYSGSIDSAELVAASRVTEDLSEGTSLALLFYRIQLEGPLEIQLSEEHSHYEWFDRQSAPKKVSSEFAEAVSKAWGSND